MAIELVSHKAWMSQTSRFGSFRSKELKTLDEALRTYEASPTDQKLDKVKEAFEGWKTKSEREWSESKRNRAGAVTELEEKLKGTRSRFANDFHNAREGLLYLYANTKVKGGWVSTVTDGVVSIGNGVVGLNQTEDYIGDSKKQLYSAIGAEAVTRTAGSITKAVAKPGDAIAKIKAFLLDLGRNVMNSIVEKFRGIIAAPLDAADGLLNIVESAAKITLNYLLPKIAPFIGSAIDTFEGLKSMGKAIYQRYKVYQAGAGVRLNSGHPAVIFDQIQNAMNVSIGKGLYQALKGGGMLVADGVTFGSSALASLIISASEMLIKLIWRIVEMTRMNKFFASCQPKWQAVQAVRGSGRPGAAVLPGQRTTEFVMDGTGFAHWFEGASFAMPCVSMIALKSGIVGDKMRMLRMFTGGNEKNVISKEKFADGVKYIDRLKEWGESYLEETGFKFYSSDGMVNGLLNRRTITFTDPGVALP